MDFSCSNKSLIILTVPKKALPILQVNPITLPFRFRSELIRCRVFSIPARLSLLNLPNFLRMRSRSCQTTVRYENYSVESENLASGRRPISRTISIKDSRFGCVSKGSLINYGRTSNNCFKSSARSITLYSFNTYFIIRYDAKYLLINQSLVIPIHILYAIVIA